MDLANLDDSLFVIHEEEISDERQLFNLEKHFVDAMRSSEVAKGDGVLRGRLSSDLRKDKTNWDDFWQKLDVNKKKVTLQFLKAPDNPEGTCVMEHVTSQLRGKGASPFLKSLVDQNLCNPKPTCCTKILREQGPKMAVKHFYQMLMSKCIMLPNHLSAVQDKNISYKKAKFSERQSTLLEQDPSVICALVEASMTSDSYKVKESQNTDHLSNKCECSKCSFQRQSEDLYCEPEELKEDGNGKNCSLYLTDIEEDCKNYLYTTRNFAMSHLCHVNMLTDLDAYYAGVSFPFVYVAGLHSFFGLHIEDMSLPSLSFNHMGNPKLWIVIAPSEITKLSILLSNYGLHNLHRVCIFKLSHKSYVVTPQFLLRHSIKFKIIIQEPGDFIFLAPNAAHTAGNFGLGVSEACNLGNFDWLPFGSVASTQNCNCLENKVHMDITPLFKMHRKDLLKFHEGGTMASNYNDPHFKRSIIAAHCIEAMDTLSPLSSQLSVPSSKNKVSVQKERVKCPVGDGCLKTYQSPVKKETLETHLKQEHPELNEKKRKVAIDEVCCKKVPRTGQRYTCCDCGTEVSVNSNRHKGSPACKRKAAMTHTVPSNPL